MIFMGRPKLTGTTTRILVKLNPTVKTLADELFANLGITTPTAINIFLRQCIRDGGIPFEITTHDPNYDLKKKEESASEDLIDE